MTKVILDLDTAHAVTPLPVVVRWLLKTMLRRFGVKCEGCEFQEQPTDDTRSPQGRDPSHGTARKGGDPASRTGERLPGGRGRRGKP